MGKKKKINRPQSSTEKKQFETEEAIHNSEEKEFGLDLSKVSKGQWISSLVLIGFIVLFIFQFRESKNPPVDPWYKAIRIVDSGRVAKDPQEKLKLMNEGGQMLRELVKKFPFHARVNLFMGYYYIQAEKYDSSIIYNTIAYSLDSGATINSIWQYAANDLGFAYKKMYEKEMINGNQKAALNNLKEAIRYKPDDPQTYFMLGLIYMNTNQPDSGIKYFSGSLNFDPKNFDAFNNLGVIYFNKQDYENAEISFKKALELKPDFELAKKNLTAVGIKKSQKGAK